MVYIRSKSATRQRSSERYQEYIKKKQAWTLQEYKDYNKQWGHQKQWKDYSNSTWNDYETMAVNPTAAADGIVDPTDHEDSYVQHHELNSDD